MLLPIWIFHFVVNNVIKNEKAKFNYTLKNILLNENSPSDRAIVSFTLLLIASSSEVVAVRTVPPSVSLSSLSSCNTEGIYEH